MMKILLFGKNGQLGWELHRTLATLGELTAVDFTDIDLGMPEGCRELIRTNQPNIIVNAAAYTAVDQAEIEQEKCWNVNAIAPGIMAEEAQRLKAAFIHYSTDYVFDGKKGAPYIEEDIPNPLNHYGRSKLEGERFIQEAGGAFLIFRTSWVYSLRKGGFVNKVLDWSRQQMSMHIVNDQIGSPTWARMLAEATSQVIAQGRDLPIDHIRERAGLYHLAGGGSCSRYDWARAILELDPHKEEQVVQVLKPANSSEFPTPAVRPIKTPLECRKATKFFQIFVGEWKEYLALAI
jgi:dTDP-4-dehydrorhamnose reductase